MDLELKGRVAIVTGGSLGIGRAVAQALATQGGRVAIVARNAQRLEQAARDITQATGIEVMAVAADAANTAQVQAAVDNVAAYFGRLDILVNGAAHLGGLVRSAIEDADPEGLLADMDIKVVGYMRFAKAAAAYMRKGGWGRGNAPYPRFVCQEGRFAGLDPTASGSQLRPSYPHTARVAGGRNCRCGAVFGLGTGCCHYR